MGELLLIGAGLLFGLMLGCMLLLRAWREKNRLAAAAAALLLMGAVAGGVIMLSWQGAGDAAGMAELVELALTLAVGPVSLLLVASLLRMRILKWLPVALASGAFAVLASLERAYGGDPIVHAVPIHAGFTLWAWGLLFVAARKRGRAARRSRAYRQQQVAFWLLVAMSIANIASLTRLLFPDLAALRPLVPATISLLFIALLAAIVWTFLGRHGPALAEAPGSDSEEARLVASAAEVMVRDRLFRDQDLKVEAVAAQLGVAPATLGTALASSDHGSFAALVQSVRLEQARLMLIDPEERATSIEAIGLLCGFRSRSAFYEGFQRRWGVSPGTWRRQASSLSGTPVRTAKQVRRESFSPNS